MVEWMNLLVLCSLCWSQAAQRRTVNGEQRASDVLTTGALVGSEASDSSQITYGGSSVSGSQASSECALSEMGQGRDSLPVYGGRPVCNDGRPVVPLEMWDVGRSSSDGDSAASDDEQSTSDDGQSTRDNGQFPGDVCPLDEDWKTYAPESSEIDKK